MIHPRHSDTFFFGAIISFLLGVLLRSEIIIPFSVLSFVLISAFSFCVFLWKAHKVYALFVLLFSVFFMLGIVRFDMKYLYQQEQIMSFRDDESYEGIVVGEPEYKNNYQRLVVQVDSISRPTRMLVSTDRYPEFHTGDRVNIRGEVKNPENFITEEGKEFNYIKYLSNKNIVFTMPFAEISLVGAREGRHLQRFLINLKHSFLSAIQRVIKEPEGGLLGGVLLGAKDGLDKETEQKFINTGTIHIVVLSGYNITIVSEAIVRNLERFIPERIALSFGAFGIVMFALLTGAGTTTVRATVMGLLGLLARVTKRNYDILRALFLAGFLMVFLNPFSLVYDISFQLSFIATLGLVLVTPLVEKWRFVKFFPERFSIREIFASTLATQITVLPFLLYKMGTLSVVAPLVNMLVLPFVPLTMGMGALAGLLEFVTNIGSNPVSWLSFGLLHYLVSIVDWFGSLSWSAISISHIPLIFILVLYGVVIIWISYNKKYVLKF